MSLPPNQPRSIRKKFLALAAIVIVITGYIADAFGAIEGIVGLVTTTTQPNDTLISDNISSAEGENSVAANNSTVIQSNGGDIIINQTIPTLDAISSSTAEVMISPTPEATPDAIPTPLIVGEPIYFNSFTSPTDGSWRTWQDVDGQAGYENDSYYVLAKDTKSGWLSANLDDDYYDFVLEVQVTPASYGPVTGYDIAVGWDETNSYYSFQVRPDGSCGLLIVTNYRGTALLGFECPVPTQDEQVKIRLELKNKRMNVFMDDGYIATLYLANYEGGKIGLGTHNGGQVGSGVEAKVYFKNLTIWRMPFYDTRSD